MKRNPIKTVLVSMFASVAMAESSVSLPSDFLAIEWLTSSGTPSVFDTGYVFTNKPLVKALARLNATIDADIAGTAVAQAGCFIIDYNDSAGRIYYRYSSAGATLMSYPEKLNGRWVEFEWGETVRHDGVAVGSVASFDFSGNQQTFKLFGGRTSLPCSFKTVVMYDGDELVRDYIPCIERSTRRTGMYDTVNGVFQPISGTAGPLVFNASGAMVEAKYVESTGSEYIDTGYVFTNSPRVDISYLIVSFYDSDLIGMSVATEPCFIVDLYPTSGGKYYYRYGSTSAVQVPASLVAGRWYDCSFGTNLVHNGETIATVPEVSFASNTQTFRLFAGRTPSTVRIRRVAMYDGDLLVRDFVPSYDLKLGEFGMFDKVEGHFYPSLGQPFRASPVKVGPRRWPEYLESTGTQIIDTDFIFTNKPLVRARMRFMETADKDVAGTAVQCPSCFIVDYRPAAAGTGTLYYRYASESYKASSFKSDIGVWHDFEWGATVLHDGTEIVTVPEGDFSANRCPFTLFGARANNNSSVAFSSVRLYEDDAMVRDMVPAAWKGEIGMYDKVEGFFYPNAGTGTFATGKTISTGTVILAR